MVRCPLEVEVMIWEKNGNSIKSENRGELADGRPALDEIVAEGAFIDLEQMAHDNWWMALEAGPQILPSEFRREGWSAMGSPTPSYFRSPGLRPD